MTRFLALTLLISFFAFLPNAFADGDNGLHITPADTHQTASNGTAILTLKATNIQVRAKWRLDGDSPFTITYHGELRLTATLSAPDTIVATVIVEDMFSELNSGYQNLAATALITVEFIHKLRIINLPTNMLFAVSGIGKILHTFQTSGGKSAPTFRLYSASSDFYLDESDGVLSVAADAAVGIYTLTVQTWDTATTLQITATVAVVETLFLADAPPLTATAGAAASLHTFTASGGLGAKTYTLIAGNAGYFSIGDNSGVLQMNSGTVEGIYTLSVEVSDGVIIPQKATAVATVTVVETLFLADAPPLTATVINATLSLHTFTASGGLGTLTYALIGDNTLHFSIDEKDGVLRIDDTATVGIYTLSVEVSDGAMTPQKATAVATVTMEMPEPLILADAPPLTATAGAAVSLHTFTASGGLGAKTYALIMGNADYFSIGHNSGVLQMNSEAKEGIYTLSVEVADEAITPQKATAVATVTVEMLEPLILADAPPLAVTVINATVSLHTFTASGGLGTLTYALIGDNTLHFSIDERDGILRIDETATMGIYTLSVAVADGAIIPQRATAMATVTVVETLFLADAPPLTATAGAAASLHTFTASGGWGTKTYTLIAGNADYFSIGDNSGVLRIDETATMGIYTLSVAVADGAIIPQRATAVATVTVVETLFLADAPPLTATAGATVSLHTFTASGGWGAKTYTLIADSAGYFSIGDNSGVLQMNSEAVEGIYTLSVAVADGATIPQRATAMATVTVVETLFLADAPPLTATVINATVSLHTFTASGGLGTLTYALIGDNTLHFSIDERDGVLRIDETATVGIYTLSVEVSDEAIPPQKATAVATVTVEMLEPLILADAPPLTATVINATVSLHTFTASGGLGTLTYALIGDNTLHFSIDERDGVLRIDETATVGIYTLSVEVSDEAIPPQKATAVATVTVEMLEPLILADAPPLTATVINATVSLHTFTVSGGLGAKTYALIGDNTLHFSIDEKDGVLWIDETATVGIYTLSVEVSDEAIPPQKATAVATVTVEMLEPLILADAPPLTVTVINATVSLHTFTASGGLGTLTYALIGDSTLHFSIDERGGVLRIDETATMGIYTLSVEVSDEAIPPQKATAVATVTVEMLEPLILADAPPLTATVINATVSLHTFTASGGLGTLTYALIGDNTLHFSIDERDGVLRIDETATMGIYTLSVEVSDEAIPPQKATAVATVTVEMLEPLILADAPPLTATVINATVSLHTFTASGGLGTLTYALIGDNTLHFSIDEKDGVLRIDETATVGIYTLSVEVSDEAIPPQKATAVATVTVKMLEPLILADAPPLTATVINATVSLHTFTASGGLGTLTYALIGDNTLHFSIDERDGVLRIDETATMGIYTLSVEVADEAVTPQKATAVATVTVEMLEPLILADAPPLTATVINATVSLHTFTASGGLGTLTYALIGDNTLHFSIDERDGVLRIDETATVGIYTLSVEVSDEAIPPQKATAVATVTVEMLEPLILADAPPLTATVINATVSLHTFTASGGLGTLTYALIGDNTLHFSIDEKDGVLRIDGTATMGIYTLSVEVSDGAIIPQRATAMATVTVVETLFLADAPPLTATVINATVSLHTFTASGGLGTLTYALIGDNTLHFSIDERDGVLRIDGTATMGIYTLSVEVADEAMTPQKATAVATVTVEMLEPLILADAPPLTVTVINATVSLHTFTASGGLGTLTYALIGDNTLHFSIDERDGVLWIHETATMGIYTLSVEVADEAIPPQKATAVATVTVEMLEPLILADAPPLTVTVINATVSLHTFTASGGLGTLTYALIGDNTLHFSIDERDGVLRIDETATVGIYTLSVEVADEAIPPQKATAVATVTVKMLEPLILADAPPLTVTVINATVSLHTFTASGGLGAKTYTLIGDNTLHFSIDERDGVLRIDETATVGIYTLSVEVSDGAMTPQKATAVATVTVEMLEPLILADAPPLTVTVINATVSLHTFTASGGFGTLTYALIGDNTLHFSIDERDGVLRIDETATMGIYTLSVEVADGAITPQTATAVATVTVVETLFLADAPPLTATVINATVSLHTFTASGGLGTLTYALIGDNTLHFSIDERDGVLRIDETATMGIYTLSVEVSDGAKIPQKATAVATVTVVETLFLADAPPLTATVINATLSLHTFTASGGLGTLTYALIGNNTLYFSIDERDGVLRIDETATVGIYTLSVEVSDGAKIPQKATAVATVTVKMLEPLILADAPPLTVTVINATVSLHTFTASGGLGAKTYALIGDNTLHFSIDERDGVLRIDETATMGIYTLSVEVSDGAKIPQTATAVATVTVVETLFLADAPPLTATTRSMVSLHTFTASGGLGTLTYALIGDNTLHFSIDEKDGVLWIDETATVGIYTLSVEVADEAIPPQKATAVATVEMLEPLILADAPPLTATVINATVSLHTFTASGGLGTLTYALIGDNTLHFSIDERDGVLRIDETATMGIYTLSVEVADEAIPPQKATAVATVTVEMLEPLILADAPPLTATVINATVSLHTFTASGGLGTLTYALIGDNTLHFSIDERDGVLRIDETATMGIYTLSVEVADEAIPPQTATAVATVTVEMLEPLILADAPPLTVTVINATVSLHTFTASGGLGTLTYALIGDNTLHFSIDERDGVLRIDETATVGIYTLSVEVSDEAITPQKATAVATVTVEMLEPLILADAPPLTATVINATVSLHTFTASGGLGTLTYALIGDNTLHFSIDERDGVLRIDETATMGIYTLSVEVADEAIPPQKATAVATVTVKMIEPLILADAPPLTVTVINATVSLHTFTASGGLGTLTYALIGDNTLHFSIDERDGVLRIDETATMGIYTLSVEVADGAITPQTATAVATVTVVETLFLADAPPLTVTVINATVSLHTFTASGGLGTLTYALIGDNTLHFSIDERGGVLRIDETATMGIYTLSVEVADEAIPPQEATAVATVTVEMLEPLILADAPPLTVTVINATVSLHTFTASGGLGTLTYALIGDNTLHFSIDERDGVLRIDETATMGIYTLSVEVADGAITPQTATAVATVTVVETLFLADAPPLTATVINATVSLHTFTASGGLGTLTYVLIGDHTLHFSIDERDGVLRIDETATMGIYTLSVEVADEAITPQKATAVATVTVEMPEPLILADAPPLTATTRAMVSLHTFTASGGLGTLTYALIGDNTLHFSIDEKDGVLWIHETATMGIYTLSVEVADGTIRPQEATAVATVTVDGKLRIINPPANILFAASGMGMVLHTFQTSGGESAPTFRLYPANSYFYLDELGGVLSVRADAAMGIYMLTVQISDTAITLQITATVAVVEALTLKAKVSYRSRDLHVFNVPYASAYSIVAEPDDGYFEIGKTSGVLKMKAWTPAGNYPLGIGIIYTFSLGIPPKVMVSAVVVEITDYPTTTQSKIYVLGGYSKRENGFYKNDVWSSVNGINWGLVTSNASWPRRYEHQALSHNGRLYVLGGGYDKDNNFIPLNDVWSSADGQNWSQETAHAAWTTRYSHQALSHNGRLYVLGGRRDNSNNYLNDVWSSADGQNWSLETAHASWPRRSEHQALSHNGRLYVLGGRNNGYLNDVWSSADGQNWSLETAHAAWTTRYGHQALSHNGRLYVLGGDEISEPFRLNDVWSSANGKNWSLETAHAPWPRRYSHQALSHNGRLYVLGGDTNNEPFFLNDVWSSADGQNWGRETNDAKWSARNAPQAVVFPSPLVLFGVGEKIIITAGIAANNLHSFTVANGTGNYTYSLEPVVDGFAVSSDGVLSADGTAMAGAYTINVFVVDEEDNRGQTAVRVNAIRLSLSFLDASEEWILQLPVGHEGVLHTLTASGGYGDYTYTLSPPGSGFVIDANGVLSADGTATPGEYTITVEVADELNSKTATWSGKVIIISAAK